MVGHMPWGTCERRRDSMRSRTFFVALLVAALAGGAHSLRVHAMPARVISAATPDCGIVSLRLSASWRHTASALYGLLTVVNRGLTPCALLGGPGVVPDISLAPPHGQPFHLQQPIEARSALARLVVLQAQGRGRITFRWSNWCQRQPRVLDVRVILTRNNSTPLRLINRMSGASPSCTNPSRASTLEVSELEG